VLILSILSTPRLAPSFSVYKLQYLCQYYHGVPHISLAAGFLDRLAFHKAMDLISIAQQGKEITRWGCLQDYHNEP
jgi:hypothetical protein